MGLYLLDYGAGNVQSLANTITTLGHTFSWISNAEDFKHATVSADYVFTVFHAQIALGLGLSRRRSL